MANAAPTPRARKKFSMIEVDPKDFKEIDWLWYPYIPAGNTTLLFGKGGVGKSTIAADIIARVTTGQAFPQSDETRPPGMVMVMSAEDDVLSVLGPRLVDAGANLKRVRFADEVFTLADPGVFDTIEQYVLELKPALIVLDPLVAYVGGKVDLHRANEMRDPLKKLLAIAQENNATILILHHSKKAKDDEGQDLAMGSADIVNATRSSLLVRYGNDGQMRLMEHVKSNYGKKGYPIGFELEDTRGANRVVWGDFITSGEDAPEAPAQKQQSQVSKAKAFLRSVLAPGPMWAKDVQAQAQDEGIAARTLNRAKEGLVRSVAVRPKNSIARWQWELINNVEAKIHGVAPRGRAGSRAASGTGSAGGLEAGPRAAVVGAVSAVGVDGPRTGATASADPRTSALAFLKQQGLA